MLLVYSRVGKNPRQVGAGCDTRRGSPAGAGAGRTADHLTALYSQKILAVRKAMTYTDLLGCVLFGLFDAFKFTFFGPLFFLYIIIILNSKPEFG